MCANWLNAQLRLLTDRKAMVGWLSAIVVVVLVAVVGFNTSAGAAPQTTPAQAHKLLVQLNARATKLGRQYAQVLQRVVLANQRLKVLDEQTGAYHATFQKMRQGIARIAAVAYEQGGLDSPLLVLLSTSPQHILSQSSILHELAVADGAQVEQYLSATRDLLHAMQATKRARAGIIRLEVTLNKRLTALKALDRKEGNLLPLLTLEQLASGAQPYENPLREISGLSPERVDMGVDFAGTGPVYAVGSGVVVDAEASGSGWPGGGWITYQLTDGPAVGEVVYFAEDVIPSVQPGQLVTPGTVIGHMWSGGDGIETGWAMLDSGSAESQLPEAGGIGGAGPFPTDIGMNFELLLRTLGVPAAPNAGESPSGILPGRYAIDWAKALR